MKFCSACVLLWALCLACGYPEEYREPAGGESAAYVAVSVYIPAARLRTGESMQARLFALRADGTRDELAPASASWECGDGSVASVSESAVVTAVSEGAESLTARYAGLADERAFTVVPAPDYSGLVIAEVCYDPPAPETDLEFIEIENRGARGCDLAGLQLIDGTGSSTPFTFPEGSAIPAGGRITVARGRDAFFAYYSIYPDFTGVNFALNNAGEAVFLRDGAGTVLDAVYLEGGSSEFPAPAEWGAAKSPSCADGQSAARLPVPDSGTSADWSCGEPTPGR